jgi:hypothetical protein
VILTDYRSCFWCLWAVSRSPADGRVHQPRGLVWLGEDLNTISGSRLPNKQRFYTWSDTPRHGTVDAISTVLRIYIAACDHMQSGRECRHREARFEVVGSLPGTVETVQILSVLNLSCGGALGRVSNHPPPSAVPTVCLESHDSRVLVQTRVVRTSGQFVAMEFVELDAAALEQVQHLFSSGVIVGENAGSPNASPASYGRQRRRFARQPVRGIVAKMPTLVDVEVIDIGATGALIKARSPLRVGDRAQLRLVLGRQPFVGAVSVVRALSGYNGDGGSTSVGVTFVEQDADSTGVLLKFLKQFATRSPLPPAV